MVFENFKYFDYYSKPHVLWQLVQQLKNREFCFMSMIDQKKSVRTMKINGANQILFLMKFWNFHLKVYNMYVSCAKFVDGVPDQSLNMELRKEINIEWNKNYYKHIVGFDWLIDVDSLLGQKGIMQVWEATNTLIEFLDEFNIHYSIVFSGNKGFHVVVNNFKDFYGFDINKKLNNFQIMAYLTDWLKKDVCGLIDLAGSGTDSRRIRKLPYSISQNPSAKDYMVFPLTDKQFDDFDINYFTKENIYKNVVLYNRGIPMFNSDKEVRWEKLLDLVPKNKLRSWQKEDG